VAVAVSWIIAILLVAGSGPFCIADTFAASALPIGTGVYRAQRAASFAPTRAEALWRAGARDPSAGSLWRAGATDARRDDATDATTRRTGSTTRTLDGSELIKIGDLHEVQNHLQEALPYYQRALTAFRGKKDRNGEATALVRIAIVMERQDKHEEALKTLETAIPLMAGVGQESSQARALLRLGLVSETLGRVVDAQSAYQRAG